jgi:hypothetical protein
VPQPSGKKSLGNFAEDLEAAFNGAPAGTDTPNRWRAVARAAFKLAPEVLPVEEEGTETS